jgi:hypothetical protein
MLNQGRYVIRFASGKSTTRARLVAAVMLRRPLTKGEIVHHINGDATDDRFANLTVVTRAEHSRIHLGNSGGGWKPIGKRVTKEGALPIRMPSELKEAIRQRAKANGRSMNSECIIIFQKALRDEYRLKLSLPD